MSNTVLIIGGLVVVAVLIGVMIYIRKRSAGGEEMMEESTEGEETKETPVADTEPAESVEETPSEESPEEEEKTKEE